MRAFAAAVLAMALLAGALLAGCSENPAKDGPDPEISDGTATTPPPPPTPPATPPSPPVIPNHAPEASLVASLQSGLAPLVVNFTLDATDEDDEGLAWTFIVDGDAENATFGTELPFTLNHTFLLPGNHSVALMVTDGEDSVEQNLTIEVLLPTLSAQEFSGAIEGNAVNCVAGPYDASPSGGFVAIEALPSTIGKPYTAVFGEGAAFDAVVFVDAAGEDISREVVGLHEETWTVSGTVPEGTALVAFVSCLNPEGETIVYTAG